MYGVCALHKASSIVNTHGGIGYAQSTVNVVAGTHSNMCKQCNDNGTNACIMDQTRYPNNVVKIEL